MSARPTVAEEGINEDGKGQASQVARPAEPSSASENVPDPDEDDLDDLDGETAWPRGDPARLTGLHRYA